MHPRSYIFQKIAKVRDLVSTSLATVCSNRSLPIMCMDVITGFPYLYFCPNGAYSFSQVSSSPAFLLVEVSPVRQTWHLNGHIFLLNEENPNVARTSWAKQSVKLWLPSDKRKPQHMFNWSGAPLISKAALKPPWLKCISCCFKGKAPLQCWVRGWERALTFSSSHLLQLVLFCT